MLDPDVKTREGQRSYFTHTTVNGESSRHSRSLSPSCYFGSIMTGEDDVLK